MNSLSGSDLENVNNSQNMEENIPTNKEPQTSKNQVIKDNDQKFQINLITSCYKRQEYQNQTTMGLSHKNQEQDVKEQKEVIKTTIDNFILDIGIISRTIKIGGLVKAESDESNTNNQSGLQSRQIFPNLKVFSLQQQHRNRGQMMIKLVMKNKKYFICQGVLQYFKKVGDIYILTEQQDNTWKYELIGVAKVQKIFDIEYENTNTNVRKPQLINVCLGEIWKNKDNKGTSKSNNFCGLSR